MSFTIIGALAFALKALLLIVFSVGIFGFLKIIRGDHSMADMHIMVRSGALIILILVALILVAQLESNNIAVTYPVSGHAADSQKLDADEKLIAMLQNQLGK